LLSCWVRDYNP